MSDLRKKEPALQIQWKQEKRVMTLEKVPVLELSLSWPQAVNGGRGGERISRYYRRLAQAWRSRWGRETYWNACLALARCRERGEPFHPWAVQLSGQVAFLDGSALSIRMDARETRGDGRPLQVRTGDVWRLPDGVPVPAGECLPGGRRRRRQLLQQLIAQGEGRRAAGDCFLDGDFAQKLPRALSSRRCCRTPEGWEFYIPQCLLAPAAEGVVTFLAPLEQTEQTAQGLFPPPQGRGGRRKESR